MPPQCGAAAWLHVGSSPRESSPCWHEDSFPKEPLFPEVRQALKPLTENSSHWEHEQCKHKEENKREAPSVHQFPPNALRELCGDISSLRKHHPCSAAKVTGLHEPTVMSALVGGGDMNLST